MKIRVGTRGSPLAMAQTEWVMHAIRRRRPDLEFEMVVIKTSGDKKMDLGISNWSGKGIFVGEIEAALKSRRIDMAVHSLKDLPTKQPRGLALAAFTRRVEDRDVLVMGDGGVRKTVRDGAQALDSIRLAGRVGTSSLRRATQIQRFRPDLSVIPIRGNLDTRLRKLREEGFDAIVVAAAGMQRLKRREAHSYILPYRVSLPAVGQGILAVEARAADREVCMIARLVNDPKSEMEAMAERTFLDAIQGGCRVPIGARAFVSTGALHLEGIVLSPLRFRFIRGGARGSLKNPAQVGEKLARVMIRQGARKLLAEARQELPR